MTRSQRPGSAPRTPVPPLGRAKDSPPLQEGPTTEAASNSTPAKEVVRATVLLSYDEDDDLNNLVRRVARMSGRRKLSRTEVFRGLLALACDDESITASLAQRFADE